MRNSKNVYKLAHYLRLVKGDDSSPPPKQRDLKATVRLSPKIIDTMRRVIDLPAGSAPDDILQQFLNKTFEK